MCRYNSQQDTRLFRSTWVTLCLCLFSVTLQATPRTADDDAWNANRRLETVASGLIISLPVIDQQALVHEVHTLNQQLTQRQENLSNQIEQNRFTAADALIVAAMPGGLIYAAIKKQRTLQAEKELDRITSQLQTLAGFRPDNMQPLSHGMLAAI